MATAGVVSDMSQTLVELLKMGVPSVAAHVELLTADDFKTYSTKPSVTVFLYHVAINGEMRNKPRRVLADGTISPPGIPIELRYLLTPWAATVVEAHGILGEIIQVLARFAAMTRKDLYPSTGGSWHDDDTVQLLPESLPVDEYHDVWEPSDIPYKLSISYMARVFSLDSLLTTAFTPVVSATFTGPPT